MGPWQVISVTHLGLSIAINPNRCSIQEMMMSTADIKPFHEWPVEPRHDVEDKVTHLECEYGSTAQLPKQR